MHAIHVVVRAWGTLCLRLAGKRGQGRNRRHNLKGWPNLAALSFAVTTSAG